MLTAKSTDASKRPGEVVPKHAVSMAILPTFAHSGMFALSFLGQAMWARWGDRRNLPTGQIDRKTREMELIEKVTSFGARSGTWLC